MNIFGFVSSLMPSISRSDAEADMEISMDGCVTAIDLYTQLAQTQEVTTFHSKEAVKLVDEFYKDLAAGKPQLDLPRTKSLHGYTLALLKNVQVNGAVITKELEDIKSEVIVSHAITASKAVILRAVAHYYFMTKFAIDFLNYLLVLEAEHAGVELARDAQLNKKQVTLIKNNLWIYARLMAVYGSDSAKFRDKLSSVENYQITKDSINEASAISGNRLDIFNNLPDGFIGSPFYTIGLVMAQWEADRYKELKDKKRLLELRLLHLRVLKDQGNGDANSEKEIAYLQRKVTDLEYKISKIEESVE